MIVTFCGHRELSHTEKLREWLEKVLEELIAAGADEFYIGGHGAFDALALSAVKQKKQKYPFLKLIYVKAYLNTASEPTEYDESVYPPLETVPPRYAIIRRNEWMVRQAEVIVACVQHDWGGAARMLAYAEKNGKRILRYP